MKRSIARWTTAFAAAAWLGAPAAGWAQTPPAGGSSPATQQQPAAGAHAQHGSAQEHIRQAQAALNDVQSATLPARSKQRVTELKRHLNALEKSSASAATTTGTTGSKTTARTKGNWATEVAAIDKILGELLGPATTSASGATGTAGSAGTTGSRTATATLDETTKTKLMEVRTHVTAFAAAMSGTGAPGAAKTPGEPEPAPAAEPSAASTPEPGAAATPAPAQPREAGEPQPQSQQAAGASAQGSAQVDAESVKRHLTGARDALSQLTQLPAAAQLQGDARTQVSQLISNFNELITTNENWRAAYDKVNGNLTALIGAESAAAEPAQPAQPATGTPGAVGTSGTTTLDPAVRAKLVEFREHLMKFEKAASGSAGASNAPAASGAPASAAPMSTSPAPNTPATNAPEAANAPEATPPSATPQSTSPQSTSPQHPQPQTTSPTPAAQQGTSAQGGAMQHIEAIEAILSGRSAGSGQPGATGTSGAATAPAAGMTLDRTQVEQIRKHLAELKKTLGNK